MKLAFVIFFLLIGFAATAQSVTVMEPNRLVNLAPFSHFLEDRTGNLTLQDFLKIDNSEGLKRNDRDVINFGIDSSAFWVKCIIRNDTKEKLTIELGNPLLTDIKIYELDGNRLANYYHSGNWLSFSERKVKDVRFRFELSIPQAEIHTIILRVQNYRGTHFPMTIGTHSAFYNKSISNILFDGMYYGIILVMALYNLFIFFTLRDISYIYYVLYMFCMGLWNSTINGYAFKYIWPSLPQLNQYADITAGLLGITAVLFATNFLNTQKNAKVFHRIFMFLLACFAVLIVIIACGNFFIAAFVLDAISLTVVVCFFVTAYVILRRNYKPAKFFLIAWSLLLLGLVVFILKDFNVVPYNFFTVNSMQIGSSIEAVLLSMALANRISIYKKEKEQAQMEAFDSLRANKKLIEEQKELLQEKVEIQEQVFMKIGQEIHDNIGQKLSLAKLNLSVLSNDNDINSSGIVSDTTELLGSTLHDLRDLSKTLNREFIIGIGLWKAIELELNKLKRTGIQTHFRDDGVPCILDPRKELTIFRIVQEALQNIIKHAKATSINVTLTCEEGDLILALEDNGVGFQNNGKDSLGSGLLNMANRAKLIGARFNIDSSKGTGTKISLSLPLENIENPAEIS